MNRNGALGQGLLMGVFIFLMLIVGGGIAAGIYVFFGSGYDFRQAEADALNWKIAGCLASESISEENFMEEIYEKCGLDKNVVENNYAIKIAKGDKEIFFLNSPQNCFLEAAKSNLNYPLCKQSKVDEFVIIIGSSQNSRRMG